MAQDITGLVIRIEGNQAIVDARRLDEILNRLGRTGGRAEGSFDRLRRSVFSLQGAFAALGVGLSARELINFADAATNVSNRLRLVTSSTQELARVQDRLFNLSQATRSSFEGTVDLYGTLARNAASLNLEQDQLFQITESVNKSIKSSGTSAQAASAGLVQLSQALGSGVLRGDELNSIMEQMPGLARSIAAGLDVPIGKLRELGAAGALTAEQVVQALLSQSAAIDEEFGKTTATVADSFERMRNSAIQSIGAINERLGGTQALSSALDSLADNMDTLITLAGALTAAIGVKLVSSLTASAQATFASIAAQRAHSLALVEDASRTVASTAAKLAFNNMLVAEAQASVAAATGLSRLSVVQNTLLPAQTRAAAAAAAHTAALQAQTVAANNASIAAGALRGALALLGGPVGIAVIAAGSFLFLATRQSEASKAADAAKEANDRLREVLDQGKSATREAATEATELARKLLDETESALTAAEAHNKLSIARSGRLLAGTPLPESAGLQLTKETKDIERLKDRVSELRESLKEPIRLPGIDVEGGTDGVSSLTGGLDKLGTSAKKATRELTDLEKAQSKFDKAIADYPAQQIVRELDAQLEAQDRATEATQRFTEQADPMTEAFENAFRRLDDAASNMWKSFFEGGKSALDNIKSFVTQTLAEIAHALTTKRLVMNVTGAVGIGGSTVATAGTGGGFGGGFNPASLFGGAPAFGPERISAMGLPTGISDVLASSSFATNPIASGIGGFAGNFGANALLGGNRGAGANIGGTLGSIAGSFLPIPIPGVGTAIGGFLGNAIGGLFGGGRSDMAQGGVLNLATGSRDLAGQTGKKFSQENATARTAVLDQAQQFSQTLAQIAGEAIQGSINIVIGSRDGLRLKTEGTVRNFGDDMDALLGGVFDSIVKQSGIFSSHLENMIVNFRGGNEQLTQFVTSLATIQRYTKTDPFADFTESLLSGTRTLYQQALVSRRELIDLARSFDGSLDAANELANATQQRYQLELALLQQIDSVARGISSSFSDTRETIIQATLSQEQLYDRLSTRAEDLARQMQTAIDPQVIGELAAQINQLTGRAFGLLGEEQKQSSQAGFLDFLSGVENLAGQRLDMSRQSISVDRDAGLSGTVASELSKVIGGFGAQQQRLLTEQERAAVAQREAAEASRRAAEAQERAALARETYYSGMGGR